MIGNPIEGLGSLQQIFDRALIGNVHFARRRIDQQMADDAEHAPFGRSVLDRYAPRHIGAGDEFRVTRAELITRLHDQITIGLLSGNKGRDVDLSGDFNLEADGTLAGHWPTW